LASKNELRIAIIGSGYMATVYAEGLTKNNTRAKLVAIHGGSKGPAFAASHHVEYEPSFDKLLSRPDIDALIIATPHAEHLPQTVKAAEHGKHVLVEKPMALNRQECDAMIAACKKAGVYLEVIQTLRFRTVPAAAMKLIEEGAIGKVRMIRGTSMAPSYFDMKPGTTSWVIDPKHGGAFADMGVHNMDIIRHLAGSEVKRVFCDLKSFDKDYPIELTAMTQLEFQNGVIAQMWMSFEVPPPVLPDSLHRYQVVGDKGILDVDCYGKLLLGTGDKWETVTSQPYFDPMGGPLQPTKMVAFYTQVQAFIDDILDHRPPTVSGEEGRAAVEILDAARMSSATGQAVDLPLPK
jgi:predicted dehydrogenase